MSVSFSYLLVIAAGMAVAFQQVINANLRVGLGSPWWAGTASYLVGLIAMLVVALLAPGPRPSPRCHRQYALAVLDRRTARRLLHRHRHPDGAAPGCGDHPCPDRRRPDGLLLLVDHFGILGVPQHDATPLRLAGAALLVAGVVLIRI